MLQHNKERGQNESFAYGMIKFVWDFNHKYPERGKESHDRQPKREMKYSISVPNQKSGLLLC
jgi:hypothetical protein